MRQLDDVARLWNDTRARLPQGAWPPCSWSWPLMAAAAGAVVVLIGTSPSDVGTASTTAIAQAPVEASSACAEQTWPYLSDACLQRSPRAAGQPPSQVRVLNYEPGMARAAIGATPWAPKKAARPPQPGQKQAKQPHHDRDRTVTVRSGRRDRNAERERVYNVPRDAYSAYGYVPRR
jgi:hypothetical protein